MLIFLAPNFDQTPRYQLSYASYPHLPYFWSLNIYGQYQTWDFLFFVFHYHCCRLTHTHSTLLCLVCLFAVCAFIHLVSDLVYIFYFLIISNVLLERHSDKKFKTKKFATHWSTRSNVKMRCACVLHYRIKFESQRLAPVGSFEFWRSKWAHLSVQNSVKHFNWPFASFWILTFQKSIFLVRLWFLSLISIQSSWHVC